MVLPLLIREGLERLVAGMGTGSQYRSAGAPKSHAVVTQSFGNFLLYERKDLLTFSSSND